MHQTIQFESGAGAANGLLCPECGGGNLHHTTVDDFRRREEDALDGQHVRIVDRPPSVRVGGNMDQNPCARRDGMFTT